MDIVNNIQISVNATQTSNTKASTFKSSGDDNSKSFKEILSANTKSNSVNDSNSRISDDDYTVRNTNFVSEQDNISKVDIKNTDNSSSDVKNPIKTIENNNVEVNDKTVESKDKETVSAKDVEESMETILAELLQALLIKADGSSNNAKVSTEASKTQEVNEANTDLKAIRINSSIEQALQQLLNSSNPDLKQFAKSMLDSINKLKDPNANLSNNTLENNADEILKLLNNKSSVNIEELLNGSADNGKKVEGLQEQFKNMFDKISKLLDQATAKDQNAEKLENLEKAVQAIMNYQVSPGGKKDEQLESLKKAAQAIMDYQVPSDGEKDEKSKSLEEALQTIMNYQVPSDGENGEKSKNLEKALQTILNYSESLKQESSNQFTNLKNTLQTIKNLLENLDKNLTVKDENSSFKQIVAEINNKLIKIDEVNVNQNDSKFNSNQSNNKSATKNDFLTTDLIKQAEATKESKDDEVLSKILNNDNDNSKFSNIANRLTEFKPLENLEKLDAPVVNRNTMAQDIVKSVKYMQSNDMRELTVKVNPGTLGEITIKLVAQGDSMKANLQVSSKDTYNLINSQEIKNALNNENIKITEVNISLYNEDTTFYKNESSFGQQLSKGNSGNRDNSNQTDTSLSGDILDEEESDDTGLSSLNIFV